MRNAGLEETQAGIKIAGRNINNLRCADDTTLTTESEEELKSLLMKVKEEWRSWLKAQRSENEDHGIQSHDLMVNSWGNNETVAGFIFWAPKSLQMVTAAMKLRCLLLGRKVITNLYSILKSQDITLPTKVCLVKAMVFPVVTWMWELDYKESWAPKNWCFWSVVLEKTLESPLDCKEIQPIHPKGNQSVLNIHWKDWCWSWSSNTLATWCEELPHLKDPDAGKDWGQEEKGTTEDEMVGWHHRLNGHEFE